MTETEKGGSGCRSIASWRKASAKRCRRKPWKVGERDEKLELDGKWREKPEKGF